MHINGACHCGTISFTAQIDPSRVVACHCTDCQVLSGCAFRIVVTTPIEQFSLRGKPTRYVKVAQSGHRRAQMFCPQCGTPLFATEPDNPSHVSIRIGCVEQRAQLKPAMQIWCRSELPWLHELPTVPGQSEQQAVSTPPPRQTQ